MAFRIRKHIAKTAEEIEDFIDLLPVDVYILGAPQQITIKNKVGWIVWFMPYDSIDAKILRSKDGS